MASFDSIKGGKHETSCRSSPASFFRVIIMLDLVSLLQPRHNPLAPDDGTNYGTEKVNWVLSLTVTMVTWVNDGSMITSSCT